jgi:hypothetical protein
LTRSKTRAILSARLISWKLLQRLAATFAKASAQNRRFCVLYPLCFPLLGPRNAATQPPLFSCENHEPLRKFAYNANIPIYITGGGGHALLPQQGALTMSKGQDRIVSQREDGMWANKRHDRTRASSLHKTQAEAIDAARRMLTNQGGGELSIQGMDGKIRDKNTIGGGNDPHPPKG